MVPRYFVTYFYVFNYSQDQQTSREQDLFSVKLEGNLLKKSVKDLESSLNTAWQEIVSGMNKQSAQQSKIQGFLNLIILKFRFYLKTVSCCFFRM